MHPPWYVHLFTADLYANILTKEFDACAVPGSLSKYTRTDNMVLKFYVDKYNFWKHAGNVNCKRSILETAETSVIGWEKSMMLLSHDLDTTTGPLLSSLRAFVFMIKWSMFTCVSISVK